MTTDSAGSALRWRQSAREQRLARARARARLYPDRLAREQRIDEATVGVEEASEVFS